MVEVYKAGNLVDADPRYGPVSVRVRTQVLNFGALGFNALVTYHASLCFRHCFYARFRSLMAIVAFEVSGGCMLFMAERNWLYRGSWLLVRQQGGERT